MGFRRKLRNRCSADVKFSFHMVSSVGEGKEICFSSISALVMFEVMNQNIYQKSSQMQIMHCDTTSGNENKKKHKQANTKQGEGQGKI